ncbi:hypothetical protein LPJ75_000958, partial [Coemansia sp. RSA 2598]
METISGASAGSETQPLISQPAEAAAAAAAANSRTTWTSQGRAKIAGSLALFFGHLAMLRNLGTFSPNHEPGQCDERTLTSDCFRLGVAWPWANLCLSTVLFVYLLCIPWGRRRRISSDAIAGAGGSQVNGVLEFKDNRRQTALFSLLAAVASAASALAVLVLSHIHRADQGWWLTTYWLTNGLFWATVSLTIAVRLLGYLDSVVFQLPLVLALFAQTLLTSLAECFYVFFTADHVYQAPLGSWHNVFCISQAALSTVALVLALSAHKHGFFLPVRQRIKGDVAGEKDSLVYSTPLSRMRPEQVPLVRTPEQAASALDHFSFGWVTPILRLGTKVTIDSGDVYMLADADRPLSIWRRYALCRIPGKSLLITLFATFRPQLLAQVFLALVSAVLSYAGPFFLQRILRSIRLYGKGGDGSGSDELRSTRLIYLDAIGLLLTSMLHSLSSNQVLWLGRKVSLRLQSLLVAELSSKALQRRSKSSGVASSSAGNKDSNQGEDQEEQDAGDKTASSDGRIANMLTSDLESVGHIASYLDDIYTLPIGFILGSWYLYSLLGTSALIGLAITVVYYPLTRLMVKYLVKYQRRLMALDDERVTMITEMFQGIRAVKLFGWQSRFIQRVRAKREQEISAYWTLIFLQLPVSFVRNLTTSLILVAILAIYTLAYGNTLTADVVFPSITVFSMVSSTFNRIPGLFGWISNCYVSLTRIESFMTQAHIQDLDERICKRDDDLPVSAADSAIGFVNASLVWTVETDDVAATATATAAATATATATTSAAASIECDSVSEIITEQTPLLQQDASGPQTRSASYAALSSVADLGATEDGVVEQSADLVTPSTAVAMSPPSSGRASSKHGKHGVAAAPSSMRSFALKNISLFFPSGKLSIVVGPTGSGKSSLLSALIGEMTLTSGSILLPTADLVSLRSEQQESRYREIMVLARQGRIMTDIAYVSQEAWLRNATIRENILFGQPYDSARYEEVLRVCALKPDLRILTAGDMTEIGERGVTLSGGQKQRVALARAVYSDRRILLIDDCLSAVDAHTGKHILNRCLVGDTPLMKGRTRVLVTHHVSACLPHCDYVAVLQDGRVALSGSPKELQKLGHFANEAVLVQDQATAEPSGTDKGASPSSPSQQNGDGNGPGASAASSNVDDMCTEDEYNGKRRAELAAQRGIDTQGDLDDLEGALVDDEEREQGYVQPTVWIGYMRMCGSPWYWLSVVAFIFICRGASILQDYWVRLWMSAASDGSSVVYWLGSYVLMGMLNTVVRLTAMMNENVGCMRAARQYHEDLFMRVMNASPRFFDKTPIGRVISRFSRDMRTVDDSILGYISILIAQVTQVAGVFVIISTVTPPFVFIALFVSAAYAVLALYYLNATRELKRLDSISMSPLLSLFSELITGVESIRAFSAQNQYTMEAMNRIDTHNRPYYLMWAANRWLCTRIEFSGCIVSFSTTILILLSLDRIDAGLAGFVLMYAISFSDSMLWFIRNYSECEISMNSVERINQYLKIEQEAPAFADEMHRPPASWPQSGAVQVRDLVIEYVPNTPVLHGISFSVAHGEKIGVVGRTGAGKSTLSLAFLRFIEATSGSIVVDNVDIATIGLEELRRNFTIIPQDPVLFNGTIRFNLDPFDEYPDELLWDALQRSHLVSDGSDSSGSVHSPLSSTTPVLPSSRSVVDDAGSRESTCDAAAAVAAAASGALVGGEGLERMSGIFGSLDAEIKENGQNLSLGQRQLVALARALVRRSRLIIMDEATASVDFDTDDRIQRTIRGAEFSDSTLFCIAHRLRTIIDYDRVLVLDKGQIVEFDTPWNLLSKEGGLFKGMCEKTG